MRHLFFTLAATLTLAAAGNAATLTLDNSTLYGMPNDIVGFGGTITSTPDYTYDNGNTPFLVITSADFVVNPGTYPVGVFTPIIAQNYIVIGPDEGNGEVNPYDASFDLSQNTGIGSYQINSFQSIGDEATGQIVLTYDEYSVSPLDNSFDPATDGLAYGQILSADATVIVGSAPAAAVPESSTTLLAGLGLIGSVLFRRYRFGS